MRIVLEIIHSALQKFSAAIICATNHSSGDVAPSEEDRRFTKELSGAAKLMGIKLLDHVIISDNRYDSFSDEF